MGSEKPAPGGGHNDKKEEYPLTKAAVGHFWVRWPIGKLRSAHAASLLARISHRVSSRGRRGAVHSGVFDPRGAEPYSIVRRAPRGEKTTLGTVHRRLQQKAGEIWGLEEPPIRTGTQDPCEPGRGK